MVLRRRVSGIVVLASLVLTGRIAYRQLERLIEREVPCFLQTQLAAALGRPVTFGRVRLSLAGSVWIEALAIPALPGEPAPPLVAQSARARLDWGELIRRGRARLRTLELVAPRIDLLLDWRRGGATQNIPTDLLARLARAEVRHLGISAARLTLRTRPTGAVGGTRIELTGVDATFDLDRTSLRYRLAAARSHAEGLPWGGSLRAIALQGTLDSRRLAVARAAASTPAGQVAASGEYEIARDRLRLALTLRAVPLRALAEQFGWGGGFDPGRATGQLVLRAERGRWQEVRGELVLDRGTALLAGRRVAWQQVRAHVHWRPGRMRLERIAFATPHLRGEGDLVLEHTDGRAARYVLTATIESNGAALHRTLPLGSMRGGRLTAKFRAEGRLGARQPSQLAGEFRLADATWMPPGSLGALRGSVAGRFALRGEAVALTELRVAWPDGEFAGELTLASDGRPTAIIGRAEFRSLAPLVGTSLAAWLANPAETAGELAFTSGAMGPARLHGHLRLDGARPRLGGRLLPAGHWEGDFHLADGRLTLASLRGAGDGWRVEMVGEIPVGEPGGVARGEVRLAGDARAVVAALAPEWAASVGAGPLVAMLAGSVPLDDPRSAHLNGSVRIAAVRLPLGQGTRAALTAHVDLRDGVLTLDRIALTAPALEYSGSARVIALFTTPRLRLDGVVATTGDRLAQLVGDLPLPLRGGEATLTISAEGRSQSELRASARGTIAIAGARFAREERLPVTVRRFTARYAARGSGWEIADFVLATPEGEIRGTGRLLGEATPLLEVDGRAETTDAGTLLHTFAGLDLLRGGRGAIEFQATVPLADPAGSTVAASLSLRDTDYVRSVLDGQASEPVAIRSLATQIARQGDQLTLHRFEADLGRYRLRGAGRVTLGGGIAPPLLAGRFELESDRWQELLGVGPLGEYLRGGTLLLTSRIERPWSAVGLDPLAGEFVLTGARLVTGSDRPGLPIERVEGKFDFAGGRLAIESARIFARGLEATGSADVRGLGATGDYRHTVTLAWASDRPAALATTLFGLRPPLEGGAARGTLQFSGDAMRPWELTSGAATLDGGTLVATLPGWTGLPPRIVLREGAARFRWEAETLALTDVRLEAADLAARGTILVSDRGKARYSGALATPRWEATGEGTWTAAASDFTGEVRIGGAIARGTARLAGDEYRAEGTLRGTLWQLEGKMHGRPGAVRLAGTWATEDAGAVARAWAPRIGAIGLAELIGGGARAQFDLTTHASSPERAVGNVTLSVSELRLRIPEAPPDFAAASLKQLQATLALAPSATEITGIRLRGEPFNLDGTAQITSDGQLRATGKAWLSRRASDGILDRTGWKWLLRLIGIRRFDTRFVLAGPIGAPHLDLSITDSWIWRFARKQLSPALRAIASGRAPVWHLPSAPAAAD